ncbi:MAG: agmatine deiminase family protein [Pseudomonadota bacterium]
MSKRVPAEWEPQAATWLQWPGRWERMYEPSFSRISEVITRYQPLHIVVDSKRTQQRARKALTELGADPDHPNITWHSIPNDNAWMRDNGPVYVIEDGAMRLQNWTFNAWGGAFGEDIPYAADNRVPDRVAEILDLPVDRIDIVHERGNLEFNGDDTVLLNWSTLGDPARNPGYTRAQAVNDLKTHFGVEQVVMVDGFVEGELTRGHIDGFARFISTDTVVVAQCTAASECQPGDDGAGTLYDQAADTIAEAGFKVIRDPVLGKVNYRDAVFDANYMNWLVGNGFVITVGFGDAALDTAARERIKTYFPDRDVYVIEMLESWYHGGGVHCHTNDQPALSLNAPK